MSGGIRISVKGYTKVKRRDLAVDTILENTERDNASETTFINSHSSNAPQLAAAADCIDKKPANEDSPSSPPHDGFNSNVRVSSVSVPSTPQIEGEILQPFNLKRFCIDYVGVFSNSKVSSVSVTSTPLTEGKILQSSKLKCFAFNELKTATRNFRPDGILGECGFGSVYKGWVDENSLTAVRPGTGMIIAVKRLNQEVRQGHKEWLTEINYLGQLHHENLVRLIGYCVEDDQSLLVYEFMPRGSLDNHLFRRASYFQPLSWNLRMKIAFGAAKGLAFLHSDEAKVIYRDFKTDNILLDSTYNAKLSDSGLAVYGLDGDEGIDIDSGWDNYVDERYPWNTGYEALEFMSTGHLTAKSNVYSFGVVMLELLSGRRAVDKNRRSSEHSLVEWAKPYLASKSKVIQIFDSRIEGQYSLKKALRAVKLAIRCLAVEPKFRPTMDDVVKALEQLQEPTDSEGSGREKKGKRGKRNRKKKVEGSG